MRHALWQPIDWRRLAWLSVTAIIATLLGFVMLTGLLAIALYGGLANAWAQFFLLNCQVAHAQLSVQQCMDDPLVWRAFVVAMGLVFSIASIPLIGVLRGWAASEE